MGRYLKEAFLARVNVPGLGHLPLNAMVAAAFAILGFAEPGLWLLGLGVEGALLYGLVSSERFRKVVDARHSESTEKDAEARRAALVRTLPPELQQRLATLTRTCDKVAEVSRQADDFVVEANRDALSRLEWVYLKLLVARHNLVSGAAGPATDLSAKIADLESELKRGDVAGSLRESKTATLAILRERLANIQRRKETLEEIDSDLLRIEAQAELLLENASIQGKPPTLATDIELASSLARENLFGDSGGTIADLDVQYGAPRSGIAPSNRE